MESDVREMTTRASVMFLLGLAAFVSYSMLYIQLPTRLTLLLSVVLTSCACLLMGHSAKQVENYIIAGIKRCGFVIAILIITGCVIGTWIVAGIIPSIIYYGLDILTPTSFLIDGLISCSLVSYLLAAHTPAWAPWGLP